jgi:hypothetical protein
MKTIEDGEHERYWECSLRHFMLTYLWVQFSGICKLSVDKALRPFRQHNTGVKLMPSNRIRFGRNSYCINPLTPELKSSAQRCVTNFLLGIFLPEPCISLIYA